MTKLQTYWNGKPTTCERMMVRVEEVINPNAWCYGLVGQERPVVVVHYGANMILYLDNIDGQGWHKVTSGKGSPHFGHKQLPVSEILGPDTHPQCRCGEEDDDYEI